MSSIFSFSSSPTINITFGDQDSRPKRTFKTPGQETVAIPVYNGNEAISGKVDVIVPSGKKFEHLGIKVEMIGHIGIYFSIIRALSS